MNVPKDQPLFTSSRRPLWTIFIVIGALLIISYFSDLITPTGKAIGAVCGSVLSSCDREAGEVCVLRGKENAQCEIPPACQDTDGGRVIEYYGHTNGLNYTTADGPAYSREMKDGCEVRRNGEKGVTEWYCEGPWAKTDFIPCPLGTLCIRGSCQQG
jgi:hypothetical protein